MEIKKVVIKAVDVQLDYKLFEYTKLLNLKNEHHINVLKSMSWKALDAVKEWFWIIEMLQ